MTSHGPSRKLMVERDVFSGPYEWRPVVDFEGLYEISELGEVRRSAPGKGTYVGRVLTQTMSPSGHYYVSLAKDKTATIKAVHVIVAEAFLGLRPAGLEVCHTDGNARNNNFSNLRWDTHKANMHDMIRMGNHNNGRKTHCKWGHPFSGDNLAVYGAARYCRICLKRRMDAYRSRRRASR